MRIEPVKVASDARRQKLQPLSGAANARHVRAMECIAQNRNPSAQLMEQATTCLSKESNRALAPPSAQTR